MKSWPPTPAQPLPSPQRSANPVLGNQSFVSVLLRSTAGELYKIRRRIMSKILLLIAVITVVVSFSFIALIVFLVRSSQTPPSAAELSTLAAPLHLPASLTTTLGIIDFVGPVLIVILAGAIVGGEYGVGTIRILLTRGPTRTQYLLAKMLTILVCTAMTVVILISIGIIVGALYTLLAGIGADFAFFTGDWALHATFYILLAILNLFIYATIALSLATLGRSTVAGVAGGILWWFLEGILSGILAASGLAYPGRVGDILKAIPDYLFVGPNINALLTEQGEYLTGKNASTTIPSTIPDWRAWLVIAFYLLVFTGISWWVLHRRDITS